MFSRPQHQSSVKNIRSFTCSLLHVSNSIALVLLYCLMAQWIEKSITLFSIFFFLFFMCVVAAVNAGPEDVAVQLYRDKMRETYECL